MEYLNRDALVRTMETTPFTLDLCASEDECNVMNKARMIYVGIFKSLPAADVRPVVRGEWIKNDGKAGWHCSICKEVNNYAFSWNSDTGKDDFQDNYCPSCGAEMRKD